VDGPGGRRGLSASHHAVADLLAQNRIILELGEATTNIWLKD